MNYITRQRLQYAASPLVKFLVGLAFFGALVLIGLLLVRFGGFLIVGLILGIGAALFGGGVICFVVGELLLELFTGHDQF